MTSRKNMAAIFLVATLVFNTWAGDDKSCSEPLEKAKGVFAENDAIPKEFVEELLLDAHTDPSLARNRIQSVLSRVGYVNAAVNTEILKNHNPHYSHMLPPGAITNQAQSGRCWIFAGLNQIRSELRRKGLVDKKFSFSENYLHFWNIFEKSGRYLADVTAGFAEGLERKELLEQVSLHGSVSDGGFWNYFQMLVKKYGVIPKEHMPDTASAVNTAALNEDIQTMLAIASEKIRSVVGEDHEPGKELSAHQKSQISEIRESTLRQVFQVLVSHLGKPPITFDVVAPDMEKLALLNAFNEKKKARMDPGVQQLYLAAESNPNLISELEQALVGNKDQGIVNQLGLLYEKEARENISTLKSDKALMELFERAKVNYQAVFLELQEGLRDMDLEVVRAYVRLQVLLEGHQYDVAGVNFDNIGEGVILGFRNYHEMTPVEYFSQFEINLDNFVVVTSYPRYDDGHYEVEDNSIGHTDHEDMDYGLNVLNLQPERMEELVMASIDRGNAVWFAADVSKDIYIEQKQALDHNTTAIMHTEIFDRKGLYGFERGLAETELSREAKYFYRHATGNHAMMFAAYDRPDSSKPPIKFLVENSWGRYVGDEGRFHMYRNWFRDNVFQVVIHKDLLTDEEREMIEAVPEKVKDEDWF